MNKVILKTSIISVAAVVLAALLVFSLWILCSPQTMATSCEKTGNYSFAVTCADLRYSRTKDISDLARCAEDSILSGKDNLIVKYCGKLVSDEGFEELCQVKDETLTEGEYGQYLFASYNSYIRGRLAAAQYRTGDKEGAVVTAKKGGVQAYPALAIQAAESNDIETVQKLIDDLTELSENLEGKEAVSAAQLISFLEKYA